MIVHKRGRGRVTKAPIIRRHGEGLADIVKPIMSVINGVIQHRDLISKTVNAAKDLYSVGKEVKNLVTSKAESKPPDNVKEVSDIISKIRALQSGSGFAYA